MLRRIYSYTGLPDDDVTVTSKPVLTVTNVKFIIHIVVHTCWLIDVNMNMTHNTWDIKTKKITHTFSPACKLKKKLYNMEVWVPWRKHDYYTIPSEWRLTRVTVNINAWSIINKKILVTDIWREARPPASPLDINCGRLWKRTKPSERSNKTRLHYTLKSCKACW